MDYLADRAKQIDASGIRRIWQMAASMKDPVNFSIGEPDFHTPEPIKTAAARAITENHNTYTVTAGIPPLRQAIAAKIQKELKWEKPSVLITCGLSGALHLALMATINPGDEILIPDPYFVSYRHLVNLSGGKCVFVDTYPSFQLTAEILEKYITPKSKILLINSPANPTGSVYPAEELKKIAEVARKHNLLVLTDEIYRDFSYDQPAASIGRYYENTLILRAFSKCYGVPGWRIGYAAVNEGLLQVLDQMTTLQQYTFVCAPHPFQLAVSETLDCDISHHIADYHHKRNMIYDGLKDRFELVRPMGAFYAFVSAPGGNATEFVRKAIEKDVLIIPGSVFSQHDSHFRLSYATSDANIAKGIERLNRLAGG